MGWDPEARCDGLLASDRARWCVENAGLSPAEAQQRVMREFPASFRGRPQWDPDAMLSGHRAADRAKYCVEQYGLSAEDAQARVMAEFPTHFLGEAPSAPSAGGGPTWDADAACDGHAAAERAKWCQEKAGLSPESARRRVMHEFPHAFSGGGPGWDPNALCDGLRAESRAKWCMENDGMSLEAAHQRVMREFPAVFGGAGAAAAPSGGAVAALGAASAAAMELVPVADADPAALVWSDEFDYTGPPDPKKWGYDVGGHGWGNGELQHYTDRAENAWVAGGCLRIRAVREAFGENKFTSARLVTRGQFDFLYGRVEARLRLPVARGSWAAAWMLPTDGTFGKWPRSGEIDIMEHVGHDTGKVHGTVHTEQFNHMKHTQVGRAITMAVEEWHTYAVDWSPDAVSFIVDGKQYHRFPKNGGAGWEAWPFDHRFHLLLNVAVGGAWGGQKGIDEEAFAGEGQVMEVAWIRVYRLP